MIMTEQAKITALDNRSYFLARMKNVLLMPRITGSLLNRRLVALCCRGASTNKPFSDGTHSKIGFRAAERVVREEEERG
jgi:CDGSH-type Zn-finger protein